jgi:hypothetical protein
MPPRAGLELDGFDEVGERDAVRSFFDQIGLPGADLLDKRRLISDGSDA